MKRKNSGKRKTKGFSFTVPLSLAPVIARAAAAEGHTRSSWLTHLIRQDREKNSEKKLN